VAYLALRLTLLAGRVLRSTDPAGLQQQPWALLTVYQALRPAMVTAIDAVPGTDPDRASFTTAGDIGRAVLADLLPPRRPRISARKVKSPLARYANKDPYRPEHSPPDHRTHRPPRRPQPPSTSNSR
jgi:hypothetical protein